GFASSGDVEFLALVSTLYGTNNGQLSDRETHYVSNLYLAVPGRASNLSADIRALKIAAAQRFTQVQDTARTIGINRCQPWIGDSGKTNQQCATALFQVFLQRQP